ncbi:carboxylesterase family protein [Hymenobacter sp. NST-14]|uniref:carboxylesterase/lipase family protein n=1 Tax=Hymenobacter piscis TaxID=2839984 RepID=UPI001C017BE9|nr:carboxylesterase family protein [Hymenobacter piscis]MBT9395579.1 carboxylesterase family protein [Hymenobacter piscis]
MRIATVFYPAGRRRVPVGPGLLARVLVLVLAAGSPAIAQTPVECQTAAGRLQGRRDTTGLLSFKGVAYAAAPVGPGRFLPPGPLPAWPGVRPATAFGPRAPQGAGTAGQDVENCLTLNVWTPSLRAAAAKPVVVWVHGGGFTGGSGDDFPGPNFARHDSLVAVSINYRLGSFGFLQLGRRLGPAYRAAGNAGVLDVVAALNWVQTNIAAFGGDPARVTLMGESAGAKLISAVLATPAADGLYQQVILESGGAQAVRDTVTAAVVTDRLLAALQLAPDQAAALLTLPTATILRAQQQLTDGPRGLQLFGPVLDGSVIPAAPLTYLARPGRAPLRALVGTNRDEAGLFMGFWPALRQPNPAVLNDLFGINAPPVWRAYERARRRQPSDQAWLSTTTDYLYRLASYRLATTLARAGHAIWLYRFDYQTPGGAGPLHAQELRYVWNTLDLQARQSAASQALAAQMHQRWVHFIRTGTPGPEWPVYQPKQPQIMVFDSVSHARPLGPVYRDRAFTDQAFRL